MASAFLQVFWHSWNSMLRDFHPNGQLLIVFLPYAMKLLWCIENSKQVVWKYVQRELLLGSNANLNITCIIWHQCASARLVYKSRFSKIDYFIIIKSIPAVMQKIGGLIYYEGPSIHKLHFQNSTAAVKKLLTIWKIRYNALITSASFTILTLILMSPRNVR